MRRKARNRGRPEPRGFVSLLKGLSPINSRKSVWKGVGDVLLSRGMPLAVCPSRLKLPGHITRFGVSNGNAWVLIEGDIRPFQLAMSRGERIACDIDIARCGTTVGFQLTIIFLRALPPGALPEHRLVVYSHFRKSLPLDSFHFYERVLGRGAEGCVAIRENVDL